MAALPANPFDPSNITLPSQPFPVVTRNGPSRLSQNSSTTQGGVISPKRIKNFEIKQKLLRPALTSHFQCWFNPPQPIRDRTNYNGNEEFYSISCSDASLPGSSLATNEINDDYHGVTERFAYRRQYDNTSDFTFYVDHQYANQSYNIIRFFESWISYACGEDKSNLAADNFTYRVRFPDGPDGYRSPEINILKFERDFVGKALLYRFKKAYPTNITSMPVSYESSQLLKCTVSFTYDRYILGEKVITKPTEPGQVRASGVPNPMYDNPVGDFFLPGEKPAVGSEAFGGPSTNVLT
jgi:hypothetical protein